MKQLYGSIIVKVEKSKSVFFVECNTASEALKFLKTMSPCKYEVYDLRFSRTGEARDATIDFITMLCNSFPNTIK